jgi:hypothetical protein
MKDDTLAELRTRLDEADRHIARLTGELEGMRSRLAPKPGTVALKISMRLLDMVFRLPDNTVIHGARVVRERDGGSVLVLDAQIPGQPADATRVEVTYTRQWDIPDPVQVLGVRWFREDGTETGQ